MHSRYRSLQILICPWLKFCAQRPNRSGQEHIFQILKFFAAKIGRRIERTFAINFGYDMDCPPRLEAPRGSIVELGDINK